MKEWDVASVKRKFEFSYAYCSIDKGPPTWRYIGKITEVGILRTGKLEVFVDTVRNELDHVPDLPQIDFMYKPINLGWCHSAFGPVLLLKTHMKSYKVGVSTETHYIPELLVPFEKMGLNPDQEAGPTKEFTIFNRFLWKNKNSLLFMNDEIGFMEGTKCFLNKPSFTALVKKSLGDTWQIIT